MGGAGTTSPAPAGDGGRGTTATLRHGARPGDGGSASPPPCDPVGGWGELGAAGPTGVGAAAVGSLLAPGPVGHGRAAAAGLVTWAARGSAGPCWDIDPAGMRQGTPGTWRTHRGGQRRRGRDRRPHPEGWGEVVGAPLVSGSTPVPAASSVGPCSGGFWGPGRVFLPDTAVSRLLASQHRAKWGRKGQNGRLRLWGASAGEDGGCVGDAAPGEQDLAPACEGSQQPLDVSVVPTLVLATSSRNYKTKTLRKRPNRLGGDDQPLWSPTAGSAPTPPFYINAKKPQRQRFWGTCDSSRCAGQTRAGSCGSEHGASSPQSSVGRHPPTSRGLTPSPPPCHVPGCRWLPGQTPVVEGLRRLNVPSKQLLSAVHIPLLTFFLPFVPNCFQVWESPSEMSGGVLPAEAGLCLRVREVIRSLSPAPRQPLIPTWGIDVSPAASRHRGLTPSKTPQGRPGCRIWGLGPMGKVPGVGAPGRIHATPPAPGGKATVPCPCVSPCPQGGFQPTPGRPFCVGREADNDKLPGLL